MLILFTSHSYKEPLPYEACHHSGVEFPGGTLKREKFPIEEFVRNNKLDLVGYLARSLTLGGDESE